MARPKEFSRPTALNKAMEIFWLRGYEAVTVTDLRKAMGIGRQSFYDTFGDKKQLFAEVLDQYICFNDEDVASLQNNVDGLEGIRIFLNKRVDMLSSGARRGCLMINTCIELAPHNAEIAAKIQKGLTHMQRGFEDALDHAVEKGQLSPQTDSRTLALYITNQVAGMVVMAKNQTSKQQLQAVVDQTMKSLK